MQEEWKTIENYSRYKVSNLGKVWDTKTDLEVSQVLTGEPRYYYVNLNRDDGKRKLERVHRLVAKAFVEGWSEEFNIVDHKDRDKLNNIYTNLRWTDTRGNQRNLENNLMVGDVFLKDYVLKYDNPEVAYSYISSRQREGSIEDAVVRFEEWLDRGHYRDKVVYKGVEVYMTDLAQSVGVDYSLFRSRLKQGLDVWNALYGVSDTYRNSFQIRENCVNYWYPNRAYWCENNKRSDDMLRKGLERGWSAEEIIHSDGLEHLRQTVLGVTGTVAELCKHFGVPEGAVSTRMARKGMTLEQALTAPREKVKRFAINGEYKTTKDWYEFFGLNAKTVNAYKSKRGLSIEQTLEYFGVDLSNLKIEY